LLLDQIVANQVIKQNNIDMNFKTLFFMRLERQRYQRIHLCYFTSFCLIRCVLLFNIKPILITLENESRVLQSLMKKLLIKKRGY